MTKEWTKDEIYKLAERCSDKTHFKIRSPSAYKAAVDMEILNKLFGDFTPWTDKNIKVANIARKQFNETGKSVSPVTEKWHRVNGIKLDG